MSAFNDHHHLHPIAMDVMRRFQPTGDAATNAAMCCDSYGIERVSEEAMESVDYERPSFNWPSSDLPQANFFVLDSMSIDVLRQAGFSREARVLKTRLAMLPATYDELPSILHHFLDFAPAKSLPADQLAALARVADELGLDPDSLGRVKKKKITNILAHKSQTIGQEWAWLVEHAGSESAFGKTAACELSAAMISKLVSAWLPQIRHPLQGASTGSKPKPSFANRDWFDAAFPMGWIHIDHLADSACVSAPMPFDERVALMAYELASKRARGWDPRDVARFGFDHMNNVGLTGSALIAQSAYDYFQAAMAPLISTAKIPSAPLAGSGRALSAYLEAANPRMGPQLDSIWTWLAYREADPKASAVVEEEWLKHPVSKDHADRPTCARAEALLEKIILSASDFTIFTGFGPACGPIPPELVKNTLRL